MLVMCAIDVGRLWLVWSGLERVIREVIDPAIEVSVLDASKPSLGCVPSLYFLCMQV